MANLVVEAVPRDEVGVATGINTIMRTLGGALGAQLVATLLTGRTIAGTPIPTEAAYTDAFIVAAVGGAARPRRRPVRADTGGGAGARRIRGRARRVTASLRRGHGPRLAQGPCLLDEQDLAVLRQRPEVVGHDLLELVRRPRGPSPSR